jgi:hypothetical protein
MTAKRKDWESLRRFDGLGRKYHIENITTTTITIS